MAVRHLARGALDKKLCRHCGTLGSRVDILNAGEGRGKGLQNGEMIFSGINDRPLVS
jgi:hypothetical protein